MRRNHVTPTRLIRPIYAQLYRSTASIRLDGSMKPVISAPPSSPEPSDPRLGYEDFSINLRRYSKRSIVDVGTGMLWFSYLNPAWKKQEQAAAQILHAYAPKIIILGMATATDHRDADVTVNGIHALCNDYLGVSESLSDPKFLEEEASAISELLKGVIPDEFLKPEYIESFEFSLSRLIRSQHEFPAKAMAELFSAYDIFTKLDGYMNGGATEVCKKVFQIEPVHFFRSGFMLFAMASTKNGRVNFESLTAEKDVVEKYQINAETCRLVASKISFDESQLRKWHEDEVMAVNKKYRKYFPNPLHKHPAIHRDRARQNLDYLIPAPGLFLRGFVNAFFSQMFANSDDKMVSLFGDAVEEHIFDSLKHIFGAENVKCITAKGVHADFKIALPNCDLVVETKTSLGGFLAQLVMTPRHVKNIWSLLYKASQQCANSIGELRNGTRPIFGLVIVGDHMLMEGAPFVSFADRSGLFKSLNIDGVDFMSWHRFENVLSRTSVERFEDAFLKKWQRKERTSVADLLTFPTDKATPAHHYQHLQSTEQVLFGKGFRSIAD